MIIFRTILFLILTGCFVWNSDTYARTKESKYQIVAWLDAVVSGLTLYLIFNSF